MKKVYCDDKVSVWQQGDLFVGTDAALRPKKADFTSIGFSSMQEAQVFANEIHAIKEEFLDLS